MQHLPHLNKYVVCSVFKEENNFEAHTSNWFTNRCRQIQAHHIDECFIKWPIVDTLHPWWCWSCMECVPLWSLSCTTCHGNVTLILVFNIIERPHGWLFTPYMYYWTVEYRKQVRLESSFIWSSYFLLLFPNKYYTFYSDQNNFASTYKNRIQHIFILHTIWTTSISVHLLHAYIQVFYAADSKRNKLY